MSIYAKLTNDLDFSKKNKMYDAETIIDIILKTIKVKYLSLKRKVSDREIQSLVKSYIKEQEQKIKELTKTKNYDILDYNRLKFNIMIAKLYIGGSVNGKRPDSKLSTEGSSPAPPAK